MLPLESHGEYAEGDRQTDEQTDERHTVILRCELDAACVTIIVLSMTKIPTLLMQIIALD